MAEEGISITGDPDKDPLAYVRELIDGEISFNPDKLARAYLKMASEAEGLEQLAYCALGWAVNSTHAEARVAGRISALERRITALEKRLAT